MVIAPIAGRNVMAVACYDTGFLLTLTVNANGSLSALGAVGGLMMPYPGIVLDGTNVLVPLFGTTSVNGAVAKVSIAIPATPEIEGTATLTVPVSGGLANAEYLAVADGYIYVTAGSESNPLGSSSTVQVVNEATMTLVGSPLVVAHSPQQIAVQGNVAYVTLFDTTQLESIDISNPANLQPLQILTLAAPGQSCHALPVVVRANFAYVGCYEEGSIDRFDISNPSQMQLTETITGIPDPQRLTLAGNLLLATDSAGGGQVFQINLADF
jgi:DNA-binding beta-propeller fold protein YncE